MGDSKSIHSVERVTTEEVKKFVNEKVTLYKAIRELEFRKELPMTLVDKVLGRVLQEEEKQKSNKSSIEASCSLTETIIDRDSG